jgi:type I restriction enzyme, S subunit
MNAREMARQLGEIRDGVGENVEAAAKQMISCQRAGKQAPWAETLPDGWKLRRLKSVADIRYGIGQPPAELSSGVAMIRATDVDAGKIRTAGLLRVDPALLPQGKNPYLKAGEIIVVRSGAYTGDSAIVPPTLEGAVAGYDMVATVTRASPHFVAYGLLSRYVLEDQIYLLTLRAAQPHLNAEELGSIILALPPTIHEQERITAYLDASCAAIDAAVAIKRHQIQTLTAHFQALLNRIFKKKDWPRERIKDVAIKIGSGITPNGGAAGYLDEGIPLLRSQNVHFDGLRLDDVAFISRETHAAMSNSQLKPRDVLINITGASIGRCTFVPEDFGEGNVNQHVCIIRGNHKIDHRFLAAFLSSPVGQRQILSSFTGASRQGLGHKDLGLIRIPLPGIELQHSVVSEMVKQECQHKQICSNIESQIDALVAYRKSLIHECVTGQRRVTEADAQKIHQY